MFASILGAAGGLMGSIMGGSQAAEAARRAQYEVKQQRQKTNNMLSRKLEEGALQSAEAQYGLSNARKTAMEMLDREVGRQSLMGSSAEGLENAYKSAGNMMSDTTAQLAAQSTARKDKLMEQQIANDNQFSKSMVDIYNKQAEASTQAANNAMKAGMGLIEADYKSKLQTGNGLFGTLFGKIG